MALEKEGPLKARSVAPGDFAGTSVAEMARVLGLSRRTLPRHWRSAKASLKSRLGAPARPSGLRTGRRPGYGSQRCPRTA
jgi:hypothetical protein